MINRCIWRTLILCGLVAVIPATATAHDFWIEPARFRAALDAPIDLVLRVGEDFNGTSQPYIPDWFTDYRVVGPTEQQPVAAIIGDDPAGRIMATVPGTHVVGYHSTRAFVEMAPEKFNNYLHAEGLEHIIALRTERGESEMAAREYYSRCAKSLVHIGSNSPRDELETKLGYTLELLPERNPYSLRPGDALPMLLQYESAPIADILVIAFTSDAPDERWSARTGSDGRVNLRLDRPGIWLVKAVHLIPTRAGESGAEWESFWASLTFELGTP
jgi:uncharacterized GH25 family protein